MSLDEKLAKIISLLFALVVMAFVVYLAFTTKWLVYALAFSNVAVIGGLFFLVSKEVLKTIKEDTE